MGDDMKRLREEAVSDNKGYIIADYNKGFKYDHKSDGIMDDHSREMSEDPWDKHQEQEIARKLQNMFIEKENRKLKKEIKQFKEENKRHIKEKNQLGNKNHLLKTENDELRYRLSSFEEHTVIIKGKLLNAIKKERNIIKVITC